MNSSRFRVGVVALLTWVTVATAVPQLAMARPNHATVAFLIAGMPFDASQFTSGGGTYDPERDQFLVTIVVHPKSGTPWSILTQLVGPDGQPIGGGQARINAVQAEYADPDSPGYWREQVSVAFNPTTDEYLLMWAQGTGPDSAAASGARWSLVYGQRISADTGQPVGIPVQVAAPRGTAASCSVFDPMVEYNPASGGYVVAWRYGSINGVGGDSACPNLPAGEPYRVEVANLTATGALSGSPVTVTNSGSNIEESNVMLTRHPTSGEFLLGYQFVRTGTVGKTAVIRRVSAAGQLVGDAVAIDPDLQAEGALAAARADGNWLVLGYSIDGPTKGSVYSPALTQIGDRRDTFASMGVTHLRALADGTFVTRVSDGDLYQLGPTGRSMGAAFNEINGDTILVGRPGAPALLAGTGRTISELHRLIGIMVGFAPGPPWLDGGLVQPDTRRCADLAGTPGDVALVNITPVGAKGPGDGQVVSSDIVVPPLASNVNFSVGTVDPNVGAAPIGENGQVCFVNSIHSQVHVVVDHLGNVSSSAITLATPSGAPDRKVDTRLGVGGGMVGPAGRLCFTVAGNPGDVALVNLTPVEAQGGGDGQLVSSNVTSPPIASNVNFRIGSVDPNVAAAPIGDDGQVCYVNSPHSNVHLVADHLGTIAKATFTLATPSGAPARTVDTRIGLGGGMVGPGGRLCFTVTGAPGDVALVNLTPVEAQGGGDGQLVSSNVTSPPIASNVNFRIGSVDPNVAVAPIGDDGRVCYVNSIHSNVHLVADHLGTIAKAAFGLASESGAPSRRIDTR